MTKKKCHEGIKMRRHVKNMGGDQLCEGTKNMKEAVGVARMSVTRQLCRFDIEKENGLDSLFVDENEKISKIPDLPAIQALVEAILDGKIVLHEKIAPIKGLGGIIIYENDGQPGASTITEFEEHYITIGADKLPAMGKSDISNFGKGHTTFYQGLMWAVRTGSIRAIVVDVEDIDTDDESPFFQGTRVVVALPLGHELCARTDENIRAYLSGFVMKGATLFYNGSPITPTVIDLGTYKKLREGVYVQYGGSYHGFQLADGSISPTRYGNVPSNCSIVITDIKCVDTERSCVQYWERESIKTYIDSMDKDAAMSEDTNVANLANAISKHMAGMAAIFRKLACPFTPIPIETVTGAADLENLDDLLSGLLDLPNVGSILVDDATKNQAVLIRAASSSPDALNNVLSRFGSPSKILANASVGVAFDAGDATGPACVSDVEAAGMVAVAISTESLWSGYSSVRCNFVAVHDTGKSLCELAFGDEFNMESFCDLGRRDGSIDSMPHVPASWLMSSRPSPSNFGEDEEGSLERDDPAPVESSSWIAVEVDGIPFVVSKMDAGDKNEAIKHVRSRYDLAAARSRLAEFKACISTLLEHDVFHEEIIACCFASSRKDGKASAFQNGHFLCVSPLYPKAPFREASILWMLQTVIHEMVHVLGYKHGSAMFGAEHSKWKEATGKRGLKTALVEAFKGA